MHAQNHRFVDALESRQFLSANAFVDAKHVLHIRGFQNFKNTIVVGNDVAGTGISVSVVTAHKNFSADIPSPAGRITKVVIVGGHLDDSITIDETNSPFSIKTRIEGRGGNDTILAGSEDDVILGGYGDDVISAGAGNDTVHGGHGADVISGGEGNDVLWGGFGNDNIDGGNGNDTLGGVLGTNVLHGDDGVDTFVSKRLAVRNPDNDYTAGTDILVKNKAEATEPTPVADQGV